MCQISVIRHFYKLNKWAGTYFFIYKIRNLEHKWVGNGQNPNTWHFFQKFFELFAYRRVFFGLYHFFELNL